MLPVSVIEPRPSSPSLYRLSYPGSMCVQDVNEICSSFSVMKQADRQTDDIPCTEVILCAETAGPPPLPPAVPTDATRRYTRRRKPSRNRVTGTAVGIRRERRIYRQIPFSVAHIGPSGELQERSWIGNPSLWTHMTGVSQPRSEPYML
jgi:hypothetical protein